MDNTAIIKRIEMKLSEIGMGKQEFYQKSGVSSATYSQWNTGKFAPSPRKLQSVAECLGVTYGYLVSGKSDFALDGDTIIPLNPTKRIPILGRISAGLPLYAEQNIEGHTYTDLNHGGEYFGLVVHGDSMDAARIHDGDTLIVRRQEVVESGQVAVVMVGDDEATVKRFYQAEGIVTLMPQSTNPIHKPQIYDIRKTPVRIIGLAVRVEFSL